MRLSILSALQRAVYARPRYNYSVRAPGSAQAAEKLGIIAGGGQIPLLLAQACLAQQREFLIIGILGEASPGISQFPHIWAGIGAVGRTVGALRRAACSEVVFVGPVRRPELTNLRLDWGGLRVLPGYIRAARGGDDRLLRYLVEQFERRGFRVIGVDQLLGDLLAPAGQLGQYAPLPEHRADIACASAAARAIGTRDIGQGAVARDGVVLAVEADDGTDAMLAKIPSAKRARRGVFAKMPKPGQERRIDLPTIGESTVRLAAASGLAGIVFEAGGVLIVDLANMVQAADAAGMFLLGVNPPDTGA